jgi:predicted permease
MIQVSRTDAVVLMKDGAGGAIRARSRGQRVLIVLQVGASLVLLASASILYGAFHRILRIDPGFDTRGLARLSVEFRSAKLDSTEQRVYYARLLERLRAEPSIEKVSLASIVPPASWPRPSRVFHLGEEPSTERLSEPDFNGGISAYVDGASPGFFDVMGIPIQLGREFTSADDATHQRVTIVSRRLAKALWPGEDPIGKMVSWPSRRGPARLPMQVVGVAGDVRHVTLAEAPSNVLYVPHAQNPALAKTVVYRARPGMSPGYERLKHLVSDVDRRASADGDRGVDSQIDDQMRTQRIVSRWIGAFGVIAMVLAVVGLYGVISQSVVQRTRELAVRSAVGATPNSLARLVLADGARLVGLGTVVGLIGASAAIRMHSVFSTVQAVDFTTGLVAIGALAAATIVASCLPARRAARLDVVDALRSD